ncbi:Pyroglutamyl-peptidase I [Lentibacillus sp. JNUCC-1]|uniref:pyroglutamyl-peptidase I n=1 Tax=Lentibacillus sp. JNUCC-1 TaxID=2654513 RepID=UPI0012E8DBB6|nr:pyroglutamyl-peptidase I [Lentibacillus sp. JNUCC-1]MUV39031.1 Pyroglutamyl-peptidase I [Lentibacillus sp. JNUCC-1]
MKKLLLTGFEPFLDNPINPTMAIVKALDQTELNGYQIIGGILPVDFSKTGEEMLKLIEAHDPDAVISLGLAAGRTQLTPERIAINCNDGPVDNTGHKPDGEKIIADGPDGYFSTLPIKDIVSACRENGLPAKISNTAGAYLCNHVMYQALHFFAQNNLDRPSGFIHLPASHELALEKSQASWASSDLKEGVITAITCLP